MKIELLERIDEIKTKVKRNVTFSDTPKYAFESSVFITKGLINELLKFALLRLQTNASFTDLNIVSIVDITRREYKETLLFYSSCVGISANQKIPSDASNGTENANLKFSILLCSDKITRMIEGMQKEQNLKQSIHLQKEQNLSFKEKLDVYNSPDFPLKPEYYLKKKTTKFTKGRSIL